jgi:hypothetical protein
LHQMDVSQNWGAVDAVVSLFTHSFPQLHGIKSIGVQGPPRPQLAARTRTSPCSWSSTHRPRTSTGNLF